MDQRPYDYAEFLRTAGGETFAALCQNVCEQLRTWDARYDWVGICWVEGDDLALKAWSGKQATQHVRIPISRGICGAAVRENQTVIVDDVTTDPRYLSCFTNTRSEIVVPILTDGNIIGEIDIDCDKARAFDERDRLFLEHIAQAIGDRWRGRW